MSKRLLFGRKLQGRLVKLLRDAGFHMARYIEEPFESLKYERQNPQAEHRNVISFHGLDEGYPNSIFASAWTGGGFYLKTIKELIPGYPHILEEDDRWVFDTDAELDEHLDKIVDIIEDRLLPWFENPVNNPAGMDMRPKQVLTDAQLKEKLQDVIRLAELAIEQAVEEGRGEDIERHERSIEEYKDMLAKLRD